MHTNVQSRVKSRPQQYLGHMFGMEGGQEKVENKGKKEYIKSRHDEGNVFVERKNRLHCV